VDLLIAEKRGVNIVVAGNFGQKCFVFFASLKGYRSLMSRN
jgi:hypothetical protein